MIPGTMAHTLNMTKYHSIIRVKSMIKWVYGRN